MHVDLVMRSGDAETRLTGKRLNLWDGRSDAPLAP